MTISASDARRHGPVISLTAGSPIVIESGASTWLTAQLQDCIEDGQSIRQVIAGGRSLVAEKVMRLRALHRGHDLREDLRWAGPEMLVGRQLIKLAAAHERLSEQSREAAQQTLFRVRIESMILERSLLSYAATELIDPQIMDSTLSLDGLCHADIEMPAEVIVRLAMARAYHDEVELEHPHATFQGDDLWPSVLATWLRNMEFAKGVAKVWAEEVIAAGRANDTHTHLAARL